MPGVKSLAASQYYAHPNNIFWKLLGEMMGAGPDLEYARRIEMLKSHGIGLWDVIASCQRSGSLDSAIDEASIQPNNFADFFARYPRIRHVFFNGNKAQASYRRYVLPIIAADYPDLVYKTLPSTSPANASIPYQVKQQAWNEILLVLKN